ncbi:orotidine-5'-phosphate decarboxylase [Acidimicrobiia bacterium]|jgi:orotidine-5'-phosphate decarboxylase|nr:orotidine-5'-phosphate decarboxylase [Acidimicrobiia bacterium]MDB0017003.1 orotidine-5'-phosphate decarboxylase [Acidimicrobiia bacterium]MDC0476015.1 orotidine-5'-phosphate decarboxylase [Acidimicrobiia bacterium]MDC2962106.1 orotidine-5'-phosphate decarboxylase [Acidimicrobiia bacterium]MDC3374126.1 orotidine-5'-phosphate decarboxylase [Acidimicrobiia bacterium]
MSVKPIFFALDGKHLDNFSRELEILKGNIYGVKVGLEMFTSEGPSSVEKLKKDGWNVFLDLKLHDIPNTVQAATISAGDIGADYLTIHIASGKEALLAAKESKSENLKLLGVSTALTSKAYSPGISQKVYEEFLLAKESKIDGVICPPSELVKTKELFELIVTPGIRLKNEDSHDQKNITTPEKAIRDGASYLVMGRSVRQNINYVVEKLKL